MLPGDEIFLTILYQIPSVSSEGLALPRLVRCKRISLRYHGHSLLFYLCGIKRKNYSCSACGHHLQDLLTFSRNKIILHYWIVPHLNLSGAPTLAYFSIFDPWSRFWGVVRLPSRLHPSEGVG